MQRATDRKPTRRRRLLLAAVLATACAIAAVVALAGGGSGTGGLGPAEALAQAAEQTAAVDSGIAHSTIVVSGGPTLETVVRFNGADFEIEFDQPSAEGDVRHRVIRAVGGAGYERQADGSWQQLAAGDDANLTDTLQADIANRALFDAVRNASGVTQDGDVYRARLSAEEAAGLESGLLGLGAAPPAEGVDVAVTAGTDGLIRSVSLDAGGVKRTVTYSALGEPQAIEAPAAG